MLKSDFYYDLPKELIAQKPLYPRDSSKLLYYDRKDNKVRDMIFRDIGSLLKKGDVLVINNTRVIYARLHAYDAKQRKYEILLLKRLDINTWEALMKPARKAKISSYLVVNEELKCRVKNIIDNGVRILEFEYQGVFEDILSRVGEAPLPPYITEKLEDRERYQTVYAKVEGSSAAPTAGLHFTEQLLENLRHMGVEIVEILLHVGLGTFRPVKCDNILEHKMHEEFYQITEQSAQKINRAKSEGRRIITVGTTSVRALESAVQEDGLISACSGYTDIFIYPPYKFKIVSGLITNFHLPESTLIMLVSAFAGREKTLELYRHAIEQRYRFFSFGDAMFIS
ncbi:MAG: tRNA preQ1(34) S-adenosylmethionine ribosyltransferase-isomerase QueA [Christensenellales bacterium]|mgnify:CR=1 FL=1|jgi:S-adenosylmethionine:tRNA ribosyltransferase-isomerase|nr:tRNA preQ1(34) S-adenosylmethionine ribosyltransferase-isomerase QueA [Clostridiales bacterium]